MSSLHNRYTSTALFFLGISVFAFALFSKWYKWNAGSALLVVGGLLTCVGACLPVGVGRERWHSLPWRLSIGLMFTYATFRLLYWPGAPAIAVGTICVAGWSSFRALRTDPGGRAAFAASNVALAGTVILLSVPVHALYGQMMFRTPGAQRFHNTGCGNWYRYSWLLYQDGQYEKSVAMIDSAQALVRDHDARTGANGEWILVKLRNTRQKIEAREWEGFQELAP